MGKILQETYEEFSDELEDSSQVRELFVSYFRYVKEVIRSMHFPYIVIPKFGTLIPIVRNVENLKDRYKTKDEEYFKETTPKITEALERLKEEKKRRKRNDNDKSRKN